jgi:predicted MFS family arabinose efflux permease
VLWLDATSAQMGILGALQTMPYLLIGLFVGAWVDRLRRRPILIAADLGRAALLGTVPLVAAFNRLTLLHVYAVGLLVGMLTVLFDVAYQSYLPSLVDRRQLVEGNSRLEVSNATGRIAGPGLGGVLVQVISAPGAIVLDAVSFVISALFVGGIRTAERAPSGGAGRRSIPEEIGDGIRHVARHRLLRPLVLSSAMGNLCSGIISAVFIFFLVRDVGLEPSWLGLTYAMGSAGGLLSAFVASRIATRLGIGPAIVYGKAVMAASALLVPVAGGPLPVAFAILTVSRFFGSGATVVSNVNQVSLRQAITPAHIQGRVNATTRFTDWGSLPVGALLGGLLGETIGIRPTLALGATGMALATAWVLFSPVSRLREAPTAQEEPRFATV